MGVPEIVALVLGSGGLGAFITSAVNAWKAAKATPVEIDGTKAKITVDLVGAASSLIDQLQEQIETDRQRFEDRIAALEREIERWKEEAAARERELENYRLHIAKQDERINLQEQRIAALEAEVRRLGGDPATVRPAIAQPDDGPDFSARNLSGVEQRSARRPH